MNDMSEPLPKTLTANGHGVRMPDWGALCFVNGPHTAEWDDRMAAEMVRRWNRVEELERELIAAGRQAEAYRQETHRWSDAVKKMEKERLEPSLIDRLELLALSWTRDGDSQHEKDLNKCSAQLNAIISTKI